MALSAGDIVGNCAAVQNFLANSVKNFNVETFVLLFGVDFVSTKILLGNQKKIKNRKKIKQTKKKNAYLKIDNICKSAGKYS